MKLPENIYNKKIHMSIEDGMLSLWDSEAEFTLELTDEQLKIISFYMEQYENHGNLMTEDES